MNVVTTRKTYSTPERAEMALEKGLKLNGKTLDSVRYLVAVNPIDGRFAPVLVGIDNLNLALGLGVTVVS